MTSTVTSDNTLWIFTESGWSQGAAEGRHDAELSLPWELRCLLVVTVQTSALFRISGGMQVSQTEIVQSRVGVWKCPRTFLQTPASALVKVSGPMGARFLCSTGLGAGNLIGRAQLLSVPALDTKSLTKHLHPQQQASSRKWP